MIVVVVVPDSMRVNREKGLLELNSKLRGSDKRKVDMEAFIERQRQRE